jgi:hypothetical protein
MGRVQNDGNLSVGAARIAAFASLVNADYIIIGSKKYEFRTSGSATPGNVQVNVGASNALTIAALVAAINANKPAIPVSAYVDPIDTTVCRIEADGEGARGNMAFTASLTGATNVIAATSNLLSHGENAINKHFRQGSYVVTAIDELIGCFMIPTGLQAPTNMQMDVWSATGLQKSLTTLCTFDVDGRIKGDFDGADNPVAGDKINWSAW